MAFELPAQWLSTWTEPYGLGWVKITKLMCSNTHSELVSCYYRPLSEDEIENQREDRARAEQQDRERAEHLASRIAQVDSLIHCNKCGTAICYTDDIGDGEGCIYVCFACKYASS